MCRQLTAIKVDLRRSGMLSAKRGIPMSEQSAGGRYTSSAMAFHWVMLALVIAVYACILLRENFPRGSDVREALKSWHFMLGLSVLGLGVMRLALRVLVWKAPAITPRPPQYLIWLSAGAHASLYALLFAMPVAGWIILSAEGEAIPFNLPPLAGADESLAKSVKELHETGGTIGYFLIGLHAAAALFHHFMMKDSTLVRMLPWGRSPGTATRPPS
jgi:cytochrome b561